MHMLNLFMKRTWLIGLVGFGWLLMSSRSWAVQDPSAAAADPADPTVIVPLEHVEAQIAQQMLQTLFDDQATLKSMVEPLSNSLVLRGTSEELKKVNEFLITLDEQAREALKIRQAESAKRSSSSQNSLLKLDAQPANRKPLDELRAEYEALEAASQKLAASLRLGSKQSEADKQKLSRLIEQTFDARQQLQKAQILENAGRLAKVQQLLETRERWKSQIVQRRVVALLDPKSMQSQIPTADTEPPVAEQAKTTAQIQQNDLGREGNARVSTVFNASGSVGSSELLRTSPAEVRKLLAEKVGYVIRYRQQVIKLRKAEKLTDGDNSLKTAELTLKKATEELKFVQMQFQQILEHLKFVLADLVRRRSAAQQQYDDMRLLYEKGQSNRFELSTYETRARELDVDIHEIESLLTLYVAAGDVEGLMEASQDLQAALPTLNLSVIMKSPELGHPKWLNGNCSMTTTTGGFYFAFGKTLAGSFARVSFEEIPDHKTTTLLLKLDIPADLDESLKKKGVQQSMGMSIEPKISAEDVQAAVDGKPLRKRFILKPDMTVVEMNNEEPDQIVVCTLELSSRDAK